MSDDLTTAADTEGLKEPSPGISVVLVNWNSKDFLRGCLQSLARHAPAVPVEIIVVDGGSFDGCDQMLAREFPQVIFIQSPDNIGFARSNNLGARHASGRYLLLLNPDTEFIDNSLEVLWRQAVSLPNAGAIGCRLLNRNRSLQTSCVQSFPTAINQALDSEFLRKLFPHSSLWGMAPFHAGSAKPVPAEAISGACILVKRRFFEEVGGFTESYFMYGEDLDLCFKLTRAGHPSYYVPDTSLIHFGGGSSGQSTSNFSTVMMRVSVHHFIQKHRGPVSALTYRLATALSALVRLALICPMLLFGNRVVSHGVGSLRKWSAIFRWSVGFMPDVRKPSAPAPAPIPSPANHSNRPA
jgi:GT2 family glycosyltransferase